MVLRARIVLGAAEGHSNNRLAKQLGITRPTVLLWRKRYVQAGVSGLLKDAPRPGRRRRIGAGQVEAIVKATLHTTPRDATHWSSRTDRKSTRLNSSHRCNSYAVFCLKKKKKEN